MGVRLVINGKVHSSDNKSKNDDLNVLDHGLLENRDAMNQHPSYLCNRRIARSTQ